MILNEKVSSDLLEGVDTVASVFCFAELSISERSIAPASLQLEVIRLCRKQIYPPEGNTWSQSFQDEDSPSVTVEFVIDS